MVEVLGISTFLNGGDFGLKALSGSIHERLDVYSLEQFVFLADHDTWMVEYAGGIITKYAVMKLC